MHASGEAQADVCSLGSAKRVWGFGFKEVAGVLGSSLLLSKHLQGVGGGGGKFLRSMDLQVFRFRFSGLRALGL